MRRAALGLGALLVARRASAQPPTNEVRLPQRNALTAPAVEPPAAVAIDAAELIQNGQVVGDWAGWVAAGKANEITPSEARHGGNGLRINSNTVQKLPASTLVPGRSYRLKFRAGASGATGATVAVKFRFGAKNETFRTFKERVVGEPLREHLLEFVAPAYTEHAEVALELERGTLILDSLSLQMRAPLRQTEPVLSWLGSFVPAGYRLVFNDEFSGNALDRHKWFTRYIYSSEGLDHLNDENQRYRDNDNQRVANGVLYLVAKRLKLSQVTGINYESGMIRSDWTGRYGFFEARVKMPGGLGVWPAFWLNSDVSETGRLSHPPEIDFFEFVNNGKDDRVNKIHVAASSNPDGSQRSLYQDQKFSDHYMDYYAPFNFNDGFHTIGGEWTPEQLTIYVDGLKVMSRTFHWQYRDRTLAGPAHILLNLAIGGQWAGRYGIDDAAFPQALAIDWVRVYQKFD